MSPCSWGWSAAWACRRRRANLRSDRTDAVRRRGARGLCPARDGKGRQFALGRAQHRVHVQMSRGMAPRGLAQRPLAALSCARLSTASAMAAAFRGVNRPQRVITPGAAPQTTGRPLASMPVSLDGMTRSAAPRAAAADGCPPCTAARPGVRRAAGPGSARASPARAPAAARSGPWPQKTNHSRVSPSRRRVTSARTCRPCCRPCCRNTAPRSRRRDAELRAVRAAVQVRRDRLRVDPVRQQHGAGGLHALVPGQRQHAFGNGGNAVEAAHQPALGAGDGAAQPGALSRPSSNAASTS